MSAALKPEAMTREAFLAWDATQEGRFEYDGEAPVAMVGGTVGHDLICGNLYAMLWQSLRGRPCRPYTANLRVEAAGRIRYPDVTVSCSAMEPGALSARDPVVVFEVLSPTTTITDATVKNFEYRATPSIRRYVMIEQERIVAIVYAGEDWLGTIVTGAEAVLDLPEIDVSLRLGDLYDGVVFGEAASP